MARAVPTSRRSASPVQVRSMSSPRPGWELADAVRLVEQGYTAEQVQRLTGWAAPHVLAQFRSRR
jgi:hypothetical protein